MRKRKFITKRECGIFALTFALVIATGGITSPERDVVQAEEYKMIVPSYIEIHEMASEASVQGEDTLTKVQRPEYDIDLEEQYQDLIWELCEKNNLSYELVLAVMYQESKFDTEATNINSNSSVDKGLFQLNSRSLRDYIKWGKQYGGLPDNVEFDVMNPEHNIRSGIGGMVYLRNYWRDNGVTDQESLFTYTVNSLNLGVVGYQRYIENNNRLSRYYDQRIFELKEKLETTHSFD